MGVGEEEGGQTSAPWRLDRLVLATGGYLPVVWPCKHTLFCGQTAPTTTRSYTCADVILAVYMVLPDQVGEGKEGRKMPNLNVYSNNQLRKSLQVTSCRCSQLSGHLGQCLSANNGNATHLSCNKPGLLLQPMDYITFTLRAVGTLVPCEVHCKTQRL